MTTIATLDNGRLSVSCGTFALAISAKEIERCWDALSHFPERRAVVEVTELCARLNAFAEFVDHLSAIGGKIDCVAEIERFAIRHVSLSRRAWAMDSRCMSWFIVGPANFPTDRNSKRMNISLAAYQAVRDHAQAARRSAERTAFPFGMPGEAIRSNNPDAPELLAAEIATHKATHERMKLANAAIRSVKSGDVDEMVQAVVDATGLRDATARRIVCPPQEWMSRGFAAYQLAGELAEIKRLEARLAAITANRARGLVETEHNTTAGRLRVVENGDMARIQLFFDGKPTEEVREILKRNGFRWAPSEGAWQRHLNNNGRWAAKAVLQKLLSDTAKAA